MLTIKYETTFKKDFKRIVKRGYDIRLLEAVIGILANGQTLPEKYRIILCPAIIPTVGNVISRRIGC